MKRIKAMLHGPMGALLQKELLETWRDRRALWMAICFSLLFPVMLAGGSIFMLKKHTEESTRLALLGADFAPLLADRLRSDSLQVDALEEGEPQTLLAGDYDLVLEVSEGFAGDYRNFEAPPLYLYIDSSASSSGRAERHLQERLGALQQLVVQQRVTARGLAPQLLAPWRLEVRDVSTPSRRGAMLLAAVPGLLILTLFVASLATSVDTSAGERERLSLETLLMQPLPGWQVVVAKTLAVASIGWVGALLAIAALVSLMPLMPLAELGIQQATTTAGVVTMGLLLLPLALLVAVVQILLALRSQSFKDAQTQLSILQVAPVMLLMVLDVSRVELEGFHWQLVPLVGQQQWLKTLLIGEPVPVLSLLAGSCVTLLLVAVAVRIGAGALRRENLLSAT
ncbi:ABC transporter permease [Microbulbifer yueqingensis]|uniref:Sodium transport system permease protein n=1 Tax=Microbulbifer yueqingensis TaxID=658219 RepID=A0A1G9F2E4_9GAMM|nr:ABC transporter permease [Microbulbifer yueqingensis]SDK82528.1 sodium transport system permease protein [Microbulbifer yueqingensis]